MHCYHCMTQLNSEVDRCPVCGKPPFEKNPPHHLKAGTVLDGKYLIGNTLGEGGFGITYVGYDQTLCLKVAVKEFFPAGFANRNNAVSNEVTLNYSRQGEYFKNGKENFLREAQSIAKFSNERGVVDVREFFTANNTAYIVMEYLDGVNLSKFIMEQHIFDPEEIFTLMLPMMQTLEKMHNVGIIHRDISPDNIIYLRDGTLKLTDFGSARYFSTDEETKSLSVMLKPGYAPYEQYGRKSGQGPWTDVYALCATLYKCITGVTPLDSFSRSQKDELQPPSALGADITPELEAVIIRGMGVHPEQRYQSVGALIEDVRKALDGGEQPSTIVYPAKQKADPPQEPPAADHTPQPAKPAKPELPPAPPEKPRVTNGDSRDYLKILSEEKARERERQAQERERLAKERERQAQLAAKRPQQPSQKPPRDNTRAILKAVIVTLVFLLLVLGVAHLVNGCRQNSDAGKNTGAAGSGKKADYADAIRAAAKTAKTIACTDSDFIIIGNDKKASYYRITRYTLFGTHIRQETGDLVNNENLVAVTGNTRVGYFGLRSDGTVVAVKKVVETQGIRFRHVEKFASEISGWENITAISAGSDFLAAVKQDGTVVTAGDAPDVSGWSDITDITASGDALAGLASDGTVRSAGTEQDWKSVAALCGNDPALSIKTDGTVLHGSSDSSYSDADNWKDILTLSACDGNLVALTREHTALAIGNNENGQCDVSEWNSLAIVQTTSAYTIGKKTDNTFVIASKDDDLVKSFNKVVNGGDDSGENAAGTTYRVKFLNYDGSLLEEQQVEEGKAARTPPTPTRPDDKYYRYEFKRWSQDFSNVTSDMTISPVFDPVPKSG